jgi:hypothetical protein
VVNHDQWNLLKSPTNSTAKFTLVSMDIEKRLKAHFQHLENGDHINRHLQSEFNFYRKDNFHAEVYEQCPLICLTEEKVSSVMF